MSQFETRTYGDVTLIQGDCLDVMPTLNSGVANAIFCDAPYGCTENEWDRVIPLTHLWNAMWGLAKNNCAILLTATQPFATDIIASQRSCFRYDIIYNKPNATGFLRAKKAPLRSHEHVLVFYKKQPVYNPQMTDGHKSKAAPTYASKSPNWKNGYSEAYKPKAISTLRFPRSIIFPTGVKRSSSLHPTQKPVALLEWLIRTYTNPGDLVLDPVSGSGTTAIAAINTGRRAICIEKDPTYFEVMCKRVAGHPPPEAKDPAPDSAAPVATRPDS